MWVGKGVMVAAIGVDVGCGGIVCWVAVEDSVAGVASGWFVDVQAVINDSMIIKHIRICLFWLAFNINPPEIS
jgi:hypothetical protein